MGEELCFSIGTDVLYLDKMLYIYDGVPAYFICTGNEGYYSVLWTIDPRQCKTGLCYLIVKVTPVELSMLFHGELTMRELITRQAEFYEVFAGADDEDYRVYRGETSTLRDRQLPAVGEYFEPYSEDLRDYIKKMDILAGRRE